MIHAQDHITKNSARFLNELIDFLRIPSISAAPVFKTDIEKAADFLIRALNNSGMDDVTRFYEGGNPIIYAEKIITPELPTILIYGHYDVQPPDPVELWLSPPFEPTIRDGKIYARGACDDKAQVYIVIKALETLSQLNSFPCNIKVLFEGEEETGSLSLIRFIKKNKPLLKADTLLVCDTSMPSINQPALVCGLRGISYCEVEVTGADKDLHSGMYGGTIINPLLELSKLLAMLKDDEQRITIPGFYDNVKEPNTAIKKLINESIRIEELFPPELSLHISPTNTHTLAEQMTICPTLDINGIWGGYTGAGPKTIIPSCASAKISMRLVPGQDHNKIAALFTSYLKAKAPRQVNVSVKPIAGCNAVYFNPNLNSSIAASRALNRVFGNKPLYLYIGGSIPAVSAIIDTLEAEPLLMGFGLESDNIHSPNESFLLDNFYKGIECVMEFLSEYKKVTAELTV